MNANASKGASSSTTNSKRWNMSAQSHSNDKKVLTALTDTLSSLIRRIQANPGSDESIFCEMSTCLGTASALQIPYRQPSWIKEIAAYIAIGSTLQASQCSNQDFASLSRFITRASSEKQLVLEPQAAANTFQLMLSFLRDNGNACRQDKQSGYVMAGSMVLHEVLSLNQV
jgi:hypothetical protein